MPPNESRNDHLQRILPAATSAPGETPLVTPDLVAYLESDLMRRTMVFMQCGPVSSQDAMVDLVSAHAHLRAEHKALDRLKQLMDGNT